MWNNHISSITGGTRKCYSHWGQVSGSIFFIFFLKKNKQTRVLAALGLVAEHGLSLVAVSGGYSLGSRLLIAVASHCRAGALFTWASGVVAHGLIALRHVGSSPNRDGTCVPCIGRWILNHWTTRKSIHLQYMCLSKSAAAAAKLLQSCPTLCDPIDCSPPGFPSLGFSRQEHWSGLPFPSPVHESEK